MRTTRNSNRKIFDFTIYRSEKKTKRFRITESTVQIRRNRIQKHLTTEIT